jgi:hypothetical protein
VIGFELVARLAGKRILSLVEAQAVFVLVIAEKLGKACAVDGESARKNTTKKGALKNDRPL